MWKKIHSLTFLPMFRCLRNNLLVLEPGLFLVDSPTTSSTPCPQTLNAKWLHLGDENTTVTRQVRVLPGAGRAFREGVTAFTQEFQAAAEPALRRPARQ